MKQPADFKKYLTPDVVSRLDRLDLVARLVVEGFITGLHRSPYHGFSVEFSEYRPYMPGDALKRIDWKVLGRTERYYVKAYEEETNLRAWILLDGSASMGYGSGPLTKMRYAVSLSAALSYLMLHQRDAVGLVTYSEAIQTFMPPRSVPGYLNPLLAALDSLEPAGETRTAAMFHELAERIQRRGLIIILSDLLDDPERVISGLKHFRHLKHEVIVFHVIDPRERDFNFPADGIFMDMENGDRLQTQPGLIRQGYAAAFEQFSETFRKACLGSRIDYVRLFTDQPFDQALFEYLSKRQRMGG